MSSLTWYIIVRQSAADLSSIEVLESCVEKQAKSTELSAFEEWNNVTVDLRMIELEIWSHIIQFDSTPDYSMLVKYER